MRRYQKGSYTIEAAIYIPIVLFVFFYSLEIGINFWQESYSRSISGYLVEMDIVQEFYTYQIMNEVVGEVIDDK